MSQLEIGRTYLTRDGSRVRITGAEAGGFYFGEDEQLQGSVRRFHKDGSSLSGTRYDIIDLVDDVQEAEPKPAPAPPPDLPNEALIQAVLKGAVVQWKRSTGGWEDLRNRAFAIQALTGMHDLRNVEFRLKPAPTVLWGVLWGRSEGLPYDFVGYPEEQARQLASEERKAPAKLLRLEVDEDLNVVSCKAIKP